MFICAELLQDVKVGEVVVVRYDEYNKGLGAYLVSGEKVGIVASHQAEGCLDFWTLATKIENNRVLCRAVIKGGRLLILSTESRLFAADVAEPAVCRKQEVPLFAMRR